MEGGAVYEDLAYSYDNRSNLTAVTKAGVTTNFGYGVNNEQCWEGSGTGACATPPAGARVYRYDPNGNLTGTADGNQVLAYNARNHTTRVKDGTTDRTMTYRGSSQIERTNAGPATLTYSILGVDSRTSSVDESPDAIDTSGTWYYLRDPQGRILAERLPSGAVSWYGHDSLGSVISVSSATGAQQNRYRYGPYGEQSIASEAIYNPWRFTGQYNDKPSATLTGVNDLYKMGLRYYQPAQRRWTQRDPLGQIANILVPPDANPYAYAGCNPTNFVDPLGAHVSRQTACFVAGTTLTAVGAGLTIASAGAGAPIWFGAQYAVASIGLGAACTFVRQ